MMRCFFDSNILIYLFDGQEPRKKSRAREVLDQAVNPIISTQVLQEFFATITGKLSVALDEAQEAVRELSQLHVVQIDPELILDAIDTMRRYRFSFWDSLIVQAAISAGAATLYTEDLQHGQAIETLKVENPFVTS